jgi:acetoin utilization deacetylase AcuC-like enzyme
VAAILAVAEWSLEMALLYYDHLFLEHRTGQHPERPARLVEIMGQLERTKLDQSCTCPTWSPVSCERLERVHGSEYISALKAFAAAGGGQIESDTVCSLRSYEVALYAAGAVCDAVERVIRGEDRTALCLVRPPGHHALIVDWDVHHGNGTQAIFWDDPRVGFYSIHRWPFYPGTGDTDETGGGAAIGTKHNVPVNFGTSRADYIDRFHLGLEKISERMRPQLVLISAGFDSHRDDPIGSLGLETEDFIPLTQQVLDVAATHAEGRVVSVLEGGYDTRALAASVELHLRELLSC